MVMGFLLLLPAIKLTLRELGSESMLDQINVAVLSDLVSALEPIRITVGKLGCNKANLLTADIVLEKLLVKLESLDFEIAKDLYNDVTMRVKERRCEVFASIAKYLHDPKGYSKSKGPLSYVSKSVVFDESKKLLERLYSYDESIVQEESNTEQELEPSSISFEDELNLALTRCNETKKSMARLEHKTLKSEFSHFEKTGEPTKWIVRLKNVIMAIKPTSTESERTFSIAGKFITNLRCCLSDKVVNALVYL